MIAASMLPDKPPSRVRHSWRCVHRGPVVETIKRDVTGRAHVVEQCQECGHDDLEHRLRAADASEESA